MSAMQVEVVEPVPYPAVLLIINVNERKPIKKKVVKLSIRWADRNNERYSKRMGVMLGQKSTAIHSVLFHLNFVLRDCLAKRFSTTL